jgi:hypothetical protein
MGIGQACGGGITQQHPDPHQCPGIHLITFSGGHFQPSCQVA